MNRERLMKLLLAPQVSEKSTLVADAHNQHVFRVRPDARKPEVKQAVEMLFGVRVNAVRLMNVRGKSKRFGQTLGRRKGWKKAYVRLAAGDDIDFTGLE